MMASQYDIAQYLVANLFRIYTVSKCLNIFVGKFKYSKKYEALPYLLYYLINSLAHIYFGLPLLNLVINILSIFFISFLYKSSLQTRVLATLMIYAVTLCIEVISRYTILMFYSGERLTPLVVTTSSIFMFSLMIVLGKVTVKKDEQKLAFTNWVAVLTIPIICIFIAVVVIPSSVSRTIVILVIICLFLINVMVFYLYDYLGDHYVAEYEKRVLQEQNTAYLSQMDIMKESQNKLKMFKHDMKNHMFNMSLLAKKENKDGIIDYIENILEFIEVPGNYVASGNDCIDSILNFKLSECKTLGVVVETEIMVPQELNIEPFYLNMILSNLLDNAIEAVKGCNKKWIKINMELTKGMLYITVSNSYEGNLIVRKNQLLTTKKDKDSHGIGLKNVELAVEKYEGSLDIVLDNNIFTANLFLYDKSAKANP